MYQSQEYATMSDARPLRSRRTTRAVALLASILAVGCASVELTASAASAGLLPACAARPTSTPFAPWGDSSSYFLMPGGGFESGASGWALAGGAAVGNGNENSVINTKQASRNL